MRTQLNPLLYFFLDLLRFFLESLSSSYVRAGVLGFGLGFALLAIMFQAISWLSNNALQQALGLGMLVAVCGIGGAALGYITRVSANIKRYAFASALGGCGALSLTLFPMMRFDSIILLPPLVGLLVGLALGGVQRRPAVWQFAMAGCASFGVGEFSAYLLVGNLSAALQNVSLDLPGWLGLSLIGTIIGAIGGWGLDLMLELYHNEQKTLGYEL